MLFEDLRYGARRLLQTPGVTVVAVLSLSLGIGANTTIFSAINALLLRRLPYHAPDRLVSIYGTLPARGLPQISLPYPDVADYRRLNHSFEDIAAYRSRSYTLVAGERGERVTVLQATAALFPVLGLQPASGRRFTAAEDRPGGPLVALIAAGFWQRRFGGRTDLIGRTVNLDGTTYTVIGVLPAGTLLPGNRPEFLIPLYTDATTWGRWRGGLSAIGRLRPGVTMEQARNDLRGIAHRLEEEYPATNTGHGVYLLSWAENVYGPQIHQVLFALLAAVGLVLLIACINVANLLLVRGVSRQRELAIRAALGASRGSLVRLLLTESVLLALVSGAGGLVVALWGIRALRHAAPADIARIGQVHLDGRVLLFTLGLTLFTGLVFGLLPAWQGMRADQATSLREGERGGQGRRSAGIRSTLVVAEVALALALLVGAGLMTRTLRALLDVPLGFNPERALTLRVALDPQYEDASRLERYLAQALQALEAVPGVQAAGASYMLPLSATDYVPFEIEGRPTTGPGDRLVAGNMMISPGYFTALETPLLRGRRFTAADRRAAPGVAVVSETMARQFWPGEDPVGKRLRLPSDGDAWRTVVGEVGDVRHGELKAALRADIYVPITQLRSGLRGLSFVVRTAGDPASLQRAAADALAAVDVGQAVYEATPMHQRVRTAAAVEDAFRRLLDLFSLVALLLAAIGLYGVIAYAVARRTREIGIRAALGASSSHVLRLVFGQALWLVGLGVCLGAVTAAGGAQLIHSQLFGVGIVDPLTYAAVILIMLLVTAGATVLPARRALRVPPVEALRLD